MPISCANISLWCEWVGWVAVSKQHQRRQVSASTCTDQMWKSWSRGGGLDTQVYVCVWVGHQGSNEKLQIVTYLTFHFQTCVIKNNSSSGGNDHSSITPNYGNCDGGSTSISNSWTLNRRQHNVFRTHRPNGWIHGAKVSRYLPDCSCSNLSKFFSIQFMITTCCSRSNST